jgi:glucoamylase
MPRDIPLGNGNLLVCFDQDYRIRDLYFPHVGQENHIGGDLFRFGVFVDGQFCWIGSEWQKDLRYAPETLVSLVTLFHEGIGVRLVCRDAVDFHENLYLREISVENLRPGKRDVRLFFGQAFNISGNNVGDTAAFDPGTGAIVHYKGPRYFLLNVSGIDGEGISQFAVGQKGVSGREGTFKDAEDGILSGSSIAQGSVDSVLGLTLQLEGMTAGKAHYWIAAGKNWEEVRTLDPVAVLYRRSLLILMTQIDWQGGIIAANDSDIIQFSRDTYSYVWPRDGALVANALDMAGYMTIAQNFYRFAANVLEREGYFLHKYNPDGTLASSWHPWFEHGKSQLPIQEDETALVIWALWNHFVLYRDIEFVKPFYRPLIKRAADFMCDYRDPETGLPFESYDLWEERRGILSFTVGAVFGGLTAASLFCSIFGEEDGAYRYRKAAAEIRDAASTHLWREELNRFCRMIYRDHTGSIKVDETRDSSLWGLFAFGLYSADDPKIVSTFTSLRDRLWVKTGVGGMARYEEDYYHRISPETPGNPWFISTLWFADYVIERAQDEKDLSRALEIMTWVCDQALPSGVLAEQINPINGDPISVSPLTWSHATFVRSTQRFLRRLNKMRICQSCGSSLLGRSRTEDWVERMFVKACDEIQGICQVK